MFLFLFVFWPLLGGCRFAAANLGPPITESTLYFSRSGKSFAATKSREKESQPTGRQRESRPSPENRLCCGWQTGSSRQQDWSAKCLSPTKTKSPARCCIYITLYDWPQIPAFLQLVQGRLLVILLQLVACCCGGCLATCWPSNCLYFILACFDYQQLTQFFYTV